MKIYEKEFWLTNGLRARCGIEPASGNVPAGGRFFVEFEDLSGTEMDATVLHYDKERYGHRAKKVTMELCGESESQVMVDALEFVTEHLRTELYGNSSGSKDRLRLYLQQTLEALATYCNVFADVDDKDLAVSDSPLSVEELKLIKQQFMASNLAALVDEDEWKRLKLPLDTVAFMNRVKDIVPQMLQTIYQQAVLIKILKRLPLDLLLKDNLVLRSWFDELGGTQQRLEDLAPDFPSQVISSAVSSEFLSGNGDCQRKQNKRAEPVKEEPKETQVEVILKVLPEHKYPFEGMTSREVSDATGIGMSSVSPVLSKLAKEGKVCVWSSERQINGKVEVIPRTYALSPDGEPEKVVYKFMRHVKVQLLAGTVAMATGLGETAAYRCLHSLWKKKKLQRTKLPGNRSYYYWAS